MRRCFSCLCGLLGPFAFVIATAHGQSTQPTTAPAPANWVDFMGPSGYRLKFPDTMRQMEVDQPGVELMLLRPQLDPTQALILVAVPANLQSIDAYAQTFQRSMSDPRVLETTDATLGGAPAKRILIQGHQVQGGRDTKAQLVVALRNDKLYSIVAIAEPNGFDSLKETADRMVESFRWIR